MENKISKSDYVFETEVHILEELREMSCSELEKKQILLKKAKIINDGLLNIIKQEDVDLRVREADIRDNNLKLAKERNELKKEHNQIQLEKMDK